VSLLSASVDLDLRRRPGLAAASVTLGLLAFAATAPRAWAPVAGLMAAVLVVLAAIDIERRIVPNRIVLPATGLILIARIALAPAHALEFILAAVVCASLLLVPGVLNRSLMGMGDVKLAAMLGAGLGWSALGALTVGFLATFPVAIVVLIRGGLQARRTALPFAPFLAVGALVVLLAPLFTGS
jgi:leader peptidase (prepilin peptidase)/N-methyltransferase